VSRRKDREKVESLKARHADYVGFRGYDRQPDRQGPAPMQSLTCSVCNRKRNVPADIVVADGGKYVCLSCQEPKRDGDEEDASKVEED
jgi:hypothetical protein